MKYLIDADVLLHRATKAVEREEQFGPDHHILFSSFEEARDKFHRILTDLLADLKEFGGTCEGHRLFLSGSDNWRKAVWKPYKTNRSDRKPLCYARLKEYILELGAEMKHAYEADDILAAAGCDGQGVVVSVDKDFLSVPAPFIHLDNALVPRELVNHTPAQARWFHLQQTLAGDTTDGYKGCPRYGNKTAAKFLNGLLEVEGEVQDSEVEFVWDSILMEFNAAGLDETTAQTNATMAYLTHPDTAPRPWLLGDDPYFSDPS
jgi:DNA polymerase-1